MIWCIKWGRLTGYLHRTWTTHCVRVMLALCSSFSEYIWWVRYSFWVLSSFQLLFRTSARTARGHRKVSLGHVWTGGYEKLAQTSQYIVLTSSMLTSPPPRPLPQTDRISAPSKTNITYRNKVIVSVSRNYGINTLI